MSVTTKSQSIAQAQLFRVRHVINQLQDLRAEGKLVVRELYEQCNPEDPATAEIFVMLNHVRDRLRAVEAELKRSTELAIWLKGHTKSGKQKVSKGKGTRYAEIQAQRKQAATA